MSNFTLSEIQDIKDYKPLLRWPTYLKYRNLSDDQLLALEPIIAELLPDITPYDIFFYKTRGFLPHYPRLPEIISRQKRYLSFPEPIQTLVDKLYGKKRFAFEEPHPLEKVILALADTFYPSDAIKIIGNRYGFGIDTKNPMDAVVMLYEKLDSYIEKRGNRLDTVGFDIDLETLLDFSREDYLKYVGSRNVPGYENRVYGTIDVI